MGLILFISMVFWLIGVMCSKIKGDPTFYNQLFETFYYLPEWFAKPQRYTEKKQRLSASSAVNIFAMIHFIRNILKSLSYF